MRWLGRLEFLLHITRTRGIARRYFVVNGFDGALTMLGILTGFYISEAADLRLIIGACAGAAVALAMSGLTSAYISERAERRRELTKLEEAMVADLSESAHGRAARWVPLLIAAVNGLAPLLISIVIISPLIFVWTGGNLATPALQTSIGVALFIIFLLGVFLGQIGRTFWLISGLQALVIALCTVALILFLGL
ncbi:MAG: hypothetical protein AMJ69_09530 [Gammaproteobacteria bacterium SG8_47]|nr:MAG: hypothetical protein AMJ69_09530 [Gammaproteobacteria bacterium SG8_47]